MASLPRMPQSTEEGRPSSPIEQIVLFRVFDAVTGASPPVLQVRDVRFLRVG